MSLPRSDEKKSITSQDIKKEFERKMFEIYCPSVCNTYMGYKKERFYKQKELSDDIEKLINDKNNLYFKKQRIEELKSQIKHLNLPATFEKCINDDYIGDDGQVRATGFRRVSREDMTLKQLFTEDFLDLTQEGQEDSLKETVKILQLNNKNAEISGSTINATLSWITPKKEGHLLHIRNINLGSNTFVVVFNENELVQSKCIRISDTHQLSTMHFLKKNGLKCEVSHAIGLNSFVDSGLKHVPKVSSLDIPLIEGESAILIETSNSFFDYLRLNADFSNQKIADLRRKEIRDISECVFSYRNTPLIELGYHLLKKALTGNENISAVGSVSIVPLQIHEKYDFTPYLTLIAEGQGPDGARVSQEIANTFVKTLEASIYKKLPIHQQIKELKVLCKQNLNETMECIIKELKEKSENKDKEVKYAPVLKYLNDLLMKNIKSIYEFKKSNQDMEYKKNNQLQIDLEKNMKAHLNKILSTPDCSKRLYFLFSKYIYLHLMMNSLFIHTYQVEKITSFNEAFKLLIELEMDEQNRTSLFHCNLFSKPYPKDPSIIKMLTILQQLKGNIHLSVRPKGDVQHKRFLST